MSAADEIARFLDTLAIDRTSRYTYATPLRRFRALALKRPSAAGAPSIETLRAWLRREVARSPLLNVIERTALIDRYLNWRAANGGGPNPIAKLRVQYGGRLASIIRALLEKDSASALDRLRPLPEWGSKLGPLMREHIARMRSLGYRYDFMARDLRRFDRFLQRRPELASEPLPALLDAWRCSCSGVRHELRVQKCGRTISQALHRRDLTIPVLSIEVGLHRRVKLAERKPYIFAEAEIARLFAVARTFAARSAPLLPMMLTASLTLSYCAGLRIGEVAALTLGDFDWEARTVEIRETKFFKSRRLPLTPSVMAVLSRYLAARQATGAPIAPEAPMWWSPLRRKGYSYGVVEKYLAEVIRRAGLKPAPGRRGPRVHDLRHTFVAHRMIEWYRKGIDTQNRLPHLATYLGHKDIVSTLVYLNITPELLQLASERFRRRSATVLSALGGAP